MVSPKFSKYFFLNLLPGGSVRNVAILTSGTTIAQTVVVLAAPVLTRLYSPNDFGLFAIYVGVIAVFSSVSSLRYELAIPLPEVDDDAAALVVLSLTCVLCVASFITVILLFFGEMVSVKLNAEALTSYLWLIPVGIVLAGAYQVFSYWHIRTKGFSILAQTKVAQSIGGVSMQLLGYGMGPVALLFGQVASQATGLTWLVRSAYQRRQGLFKGICVNQVRAQARRYRRFPLYSSWGGLFNVAGANLPPILFAALFSPAVAGLYALANRVLSMPMSLVGSAIGQVYFSKAAEARRDGSIGNLVSKVHDKLAQIAMPPVLFLVFVAPEMFSFIFGSEWRQAGIFVQWLTPMLYFQFIFAPIGQTLVVMERQELGTLLQGVMLLLRTLALVLGAWFGDVLLTVCLFGIASSIGYLLFLIVTMHITDVAWSEVTRATVIAFSWGVIAVFPLALAEFIQIKNQVLMLPFILISLTIIIVRYRMIISYK